jgi:hypothetical protein
VSISLSRQPAIQGKAETISIITENPFAVSIRYYDELGREVGQTEDGALSSEHSIHFTPEILGVTYYTIRGVSASGMWQRAGRLLTLPSQ